MIDKSVDSRPDLNVLIPIFFSDNIQADFGCSHLFIADTKINNTFESTQSSLTDTLTGEYESSVDIFSAQLT